MPRGSRGGSRSRSSGGGSRGGSRSFGGSRHRGGSRYRSYGHRRYYGRRYRGYGYYGYGRSYGGGFCSMICGVIFLSIFLAAIVAGASFFIVGSSMTGNLEPSDIDPYTLDRTAENLVYSIDDVLWEPDGTHYFEEGTVISVNWTSNGELDFYIMKQSDFEDFWDGYTFSYAVTRVDSTGDTLDFTVPSTDRWLVVWYYAIVQYDGPTQLQIDVDYQIDFPASANTYVHPFFPTATYIFLGVLVGIPLIACIVGVAKKATKDPKQYIPVTQDPSTYVPQQTVQAVPSQKYVPDNRSCPTCGSLLDYGDAYCQNCGQKL